MKNLKNNLLKSFILTGSGVILFSSLINIWDNKARLNNLVLKIFPQGYSELEKKINSKSDKFWFNELKKGGYIIFMRHAQREKWIDVGMFDSVETSSSRRGENEYFANAVCLSNRGKIQARMMNEVIFKHGMKIGTVISSPSCRARQTAEIVFKKLDMENKLLVHGGIFNEEKEEWQKKLRNLLDNLPLEENSNTVITGHGSTIYKSIFDNKDEIDYPSKINEGGFYILSRKKGKLKLEHEFINFQDFSSLLNKRL